MNIWRRRKPMQGCYGSQKNFANGAAKQFVTQNITDGTVGIDALHDALMHLPGAMRQVAT